MEPQGRAPSFCSELKGGTRMRKSLLAVATGAALRAALQPPRINLPKAPQMLRLSCKARHRINQLWPPFRRLLRTSRVCRVDRRQVDRPPMSPGGWVPRWIARGTSGRHRTNSSCRTGQAGTPQTAWAIACHRCTSGEGKGGTQFSRMPLPFLEYARGPGDRAERSAVRYSNNGQVAARKNAARNG